MEPKQFDDERLTIGGLDDLVTFVWLSAHCVWTVLSLEVLLDNGLTWIKLPAWLEDLLTVGVGREGLNSGEEDFLCSTCLD